MAIKESLPAAPAQNTSGIADPNELKRLVIDPNRDSEMSPQIMKLQDSCCSLIIADVEKIWKDKMTVSVRKTKCSWL